MKPVASATPRSARIPALACAMLALVLAAPPAFAVNKDMVQLQTQVQELQDAVARLQQSNDERMGVLKDLLQQNADSVNKMSVTVTALEKNLSSQQEANGGKLDQVSGQVQGLNNSVDEITARLNSLEKGLQAVQSQLQSINVALQNLQPPAGAAPATNPDGSPVVPSGASQPGAQPAGPPMTDSKPSAGTPFAATQGPPQQPAYTPPSTQAATPPVTDLYQAALNDYMAAKYGLATSEFGQVIRVSPNDPLAGNAYYYLGEIDFHANKPSTAIKDFNHVLDQFPGNPKVPVSHLRKAEALLAMKERDAAIAEFRALIQRFPNSAEATQARNKLNGLGVPAGPRRPA